MHPAPPELCLDGAPRRPDGRAAWEAPGTGCGQWGNGYIMATAPRVWKGSVIKMPLRPEGSTVEHLIEDHRAQVQLLLGTLMYPSLPFLALKYSITVKLRVYNRVAQ